MLKTARAFLQRDGASSANSSELNRIRDDRVAGTCEWIREHSVFQQWISDEGRAHPILWVHGKQGIGKSVLCAAVVDHLRDDPALNGVAFQFITRQQFLTKQQLLGNLAGQLLGTLIDRNEHVISSSMQRCLDNLDDENQAWILVRHIFERLPRTYILFDGIDEVDYVDDESQTDTKLRSRKVLYDFFKLVLAEVRRIPDKIRIWCSSQVTTKITHCLNPEHDSVAQIALTPGHTADDMYKFLMEKVEAPNDLTDRISKALITAAVLTEVEGSFLWVKLMLEGMNDPESPLESFNDKVEYIRRSLPRSMENTYTMIMRRIQARADESNKNLATWR